jgi:hypothetical protein
MPLGPSAPIAPLGATAPPVEVRLMLRKQLAEILSKSHHALGCDHHSS